MKIKRVYIAAFGGLKNKTVDFEDGFNVIYGENENGKTTVMTFIKMMFYGSAGLPPLLKIRAKNTPRGAGKSLLAALILSTAAEATA